MRSVFVNVPGLLAPERGGQDDVGEPRGFAQEGVRDDQEEPILREDRPDPPSSGSETAGFVPLTQRNSIEPCSA